jgi:pimeloyl-ACP methyl ester carboxylesterase
LDISHTSPTGNLDAYRSVASVTDVLFLPGIIAPAELRYEALVSHLDGIDAKLKDLEVYRHDAPPVGYSMQTEVDGLDRVVNEAGLDRFHVYGHSGGGAVALAYAATHGERLLSLAVDEPATDFTDEGNADYGWADFDEALNLPPAESVRAFMRLQVSNEVELPPLPTRSPPWMSTRPAGVRAFIAAAREHSIDPSEFRSFPAPVFFSRGSLTHPRWTLMQARLERLFADFTGEVYEGLHHLNTSHQAEPQRVATALRALWTRAERAVKSRLPGSL